MSYTVVQQPDEYSLSAMVKDFIITSTANITFEILQGTTSLLLETYTPDASGTIKVLDLGRFFENYVSGTIDEIDHPTLMGSFTVKIDTVALARIFKVLKCKAYSDVPAPDFVNGNVFLNLLKQIKTITRTSNEYITCKLLAPVKVFVTYMVAGIPTNSDEVTLDGSASGTFRTMDVSFSVISAMFPAIDASTIVALRIKTANQIQVLMVDRANYLAPLNFMFKNSFDVPETIVTRGNVTRKGETTFNTATINRTELKYNVERVDKFTVNSGKIFSMNDYERYRELFNSEDVRIYYLGSWRKIVISEEQSETSIRSGNLIPVAFTFHFANVIDNRFITGESFMRWILEYGKWEDNKVWLDDGQWLDS